MKKRYSFESLFEGNLFVLASVFYTVNIFVTVVVNSIAGSMENVSAPSLWDFIFLGAIILPLAIWKSDYIRKKEYPFWLGITVFYLTALGLVVFVTFVQGFLGELSERIYFYAFTNFTTVFSIVLVGAIIVDFMQTATGNKNLKKIQANQKSLKP